MQWKSELNEMMRFLKEMIRIWSEHLTSTGGLSSSLILYYIWIDGTGESYEYPYLPQ